MSCRLVPGGVGGWPGGAGPVLFDIVGFVERLERAFWRDVRAAFFWLLAGGMIVWCILVFIGEPFGFLMGTLRSLDGQRSS